MIICSTSLTTEQIAQQLANVTLFLAGYGLADITLTIGKLVLS